MYNHITNKCVNMRVLDTRVATKAKFRGIVYEPSKIHLSWNQDLKNTVLVYIENVGYLVGSRFAPDTINEGLMVHEYITKDLAVTMRSILDMEPTSRWDAA